MNTGTTQLQVIAFYMRQQVDSIRWNLPDEEKAGDGDIIELRRYQYNALRTSQKRLIDLADLVDSIAADGQRILELDSKLYEAQSNIREKNGEIAELETKVEELGEIITAMEGD